MSFCFRPFRGDRAWLDPAGRPLPSTIVRAILAIHNANKRRAYFDEHRRMLEIRTRQGLWAPSRIRRSVCCLEHSHASAVHTVSCGTGVYYAVIKLHPGFAVEIWAKKWIWSTVRLIVRQEITSGG